MDRSLFGNSSLKYKCLQDTAKKMSYGHNMANTKNVFYWHKVFLCLGLLMTILICNVEIESASCYIFVLVGELAIYFYFIVPNATNVISKCWATVRNYICIDLVDLYFCVTFDIFICRILNHWLVILCSICFEDKTYQIRRNSL